MTQRWILVFIAFATLALGEGRAEPFTPGAAAQVVERLPAVLVAPEMRELRERRAELSRDPRNLDLAVELAWRYIKLGRAEFDPRYYGYAQAALAPWWDAAEPPTTVLLLRATLLQNRHDFTGALVDLENLLRRDPRNGQAWLTRAVVLAVRAEYDAALRSCLPLGRLAGALLASACSANALNLQGQAERGYGLLQQVLARYPAAPVAERLWALTLLAEIAARQGQAEQAEAHYQQALALGERDVYLLMAYADFLLDQDRAAAAQALLANETRVDPLFLRLVLAEQRLNAAALPEHRAAMQARFEEARLRGDRTHLGDGARFALYLQHQPEQALRMALANWEQQREPRDARWVLEAALAAGDRDAARPVLEWLRANRVEDVRLSALAQRLKEIPG